MKLRVDRTKWGRGRCTRLLSTAPSFSYTPDYIGDEPVMMCTRIDEREQCILGLLFTALGVPDHALNGRSAPCTTELQPSGPILSKLLRRPTVYERISHAHEFTNTDLANTIMGVNDQRASVNTAQLMDRFEGHPADCKCHTECVPARTLIRNDGKIPPAQFEAERERRLIELLAKIGVDLEFYN